MKPEDQRIEIAEACGWVPRKMKNSQTRYWTPPLDVQWSHQIHQLPDYLSDLNACHEMEKVLTEEQQNLYQTGLSNMIGCDGFDAYRHWSDVGSVFTCHATAAQRAEAFLRTLGLWTDS